MSQRLVQCTGGQRQRARLVSFQLMKPRLAKISAQGQRWALYWAALRLLRTVYLVRLLFLRRLCVSFLNSIMVRVGKDLDDASTFVSVQRQSRCLCHLTPSLVISVYSVHIRYTSARVSLRSWTDLYFRIPVQ